MAIGRHFHMNRQDRRWVTLAAGLLALWLQVVSPFALMNGMQAGMSQQAAVADAIDYLCQPITVEHGKDGRSKHLLRLDCQICQSLHLLAQGLTPSAIILALPSVIAADHQPAIRAGAAPLRLSLAFSSRAPPVL